MKRFLSSLMVLCLLLGASGAMAGGPGGHHGPPPPPHHRHHGHDYRGAYLLGGLAIGAVLTDAFIDRGPSVVYVEPSPPARVVYRERPVTRVVVAQPERSLLRDLHGNCYELSTDHFGNELRTQLPASQCNW